MSDGGAAQDQLLRRRPPRLIKGDRAVATGGRVDIGPGPRGGGFRGEGVRFGDLSLLTEGLFQSQQRPCVGGMVFEVHPVDGFRFHGLAMGQEEGAEDEWSRIHVLEHPARKGRAIRRLGRANRPSDGGGFGFDRGPREMHTVICAECGNEATVPFRPRGDRPVYCSDCFSRQGGGAGGGGRY